MTEQRKSGNIPAAPEEVTVEEADATVEISPTEHLLKRLEGRYERTDEKRNGATGVYFRDGDKTAFLVVISDATGRIKVQTPTKQKVLDGLETVEDAEKVLAEFLG